MKKAETKKVTTSKEVKAPVANKKSGSPKKAVKTATKTVAKKSAASASVKTAAPKKATASKKAAVSNKGALEAKIVLQYGEISLDQETLMANVQNFLQFDRNLALADQVGVEIYVKPEDGKAYIVVDGVEEGSMLL